MKHLLFSSRGTHGAPAPDFSSSRAIASVVLALAVLPALSAIAAPTVSDHTISWPDDGWYQVQNTSDYASVCEGGRSCEVQEGIYVVINHTSGERFENIIVGGDDDGAQVMVNGNTISWPDDGWYQVQNASDYASVCEGGRSCDVAVGVYIVINHTSGERFENVEVVDTGVEGPDSNPYSAITVENHVAVLDHVFGLFNGSSSEFGDEILALPGFPDPRYSVSPPEVPQEQADSQPTDELSCEYGGNAKFTPFQQESSDTVLGWSMEFDGCVVDSPADGGRRLSGDFLRVNQTIKIAESTDFVSGSIPVVRRFSGRLTWLARAPQDGEGRAWRMENVNYSVSGPGAPHIPFSLQDANTELYSRRPYERSMEGSLTILDPTVAAQKTLEVTVAEPLRQRISVSEENPAEIFDNKVQFETGRLEIQAEDGSSLVLDAGAGVPETADITITNRDGQTDVVEQPWTLWAHQLTCAQESSGRGGCL